MKKLILSGFITLCLTGCAVKSPSDNEIRRGLETHNFLVISEQNKVIIEQNKQILESLDQISEYQNRILEKLEDKY